MPTEIIGPYAYWIPSGGGGVTEKVLIRDYTGDDASNRVIDLGADYDLIIIRTRTSFTQFESHPTEVGSLRDIFWNAYNDATGAKVEHLSMAAASAQYQGKMTGGDANKIKLGTGSGGVHGVNELGVLYRIFAMKFSTVEA